MTAALQLLQLDSIRGKPLVIGMLRCQLLFDFSVIVDLAFLRINEQDLSGLQTSLLSHFGRIKIHHADLTCHYDRIILRDGVSGRAQTVTVKHTSRKASVAEQQGSRSVPWFHQDGVVFIKGLQVVRYRILVIERLRNKNSHRMR